MTAPMSAPLYADVLRERAKLRRRARDTIRRLCEETEVLTVTEWADKYRMLPDTSTSPGPYDSSITPYARRPQDLLGDPSSSTVVLCWASQTTKSTVIENGIGFRIHRMPSPMVIVQPKIDAAESWARERLDPMIQVTPVLRARVRQGRTSGSLLRYKRFAGGFTFVASAQSATERASRSSPFVGCDEVDRYEVLPGEGNPVEIVARRQGAADVGCLFLTSTPRDAESTIIWPYLEAGTFEVYNVPCPHCGHMQPLVWQNLRWEKGRPETAQYMCAECACLIDESEKPAMLKVGEWVATNPDGDYPSFHLNALYSPFAKSRWAVLAKEWDAAQGRPADLQVFVNTRLAELWEEKGDQTDGNALLQRLEPHTEGVVPEGVGLLTCGVDAQQSFLVAWVWGWGAGLESWPVAVAVFPGDPLVEPDTPGSCWSALDTWLAQPWPVQRPDGSLGAGLGIARTFIDSGHATTQVYRFTRRRAARGIYASKGASVREAPLVSKPSVVGVDKTVLYLVGGDKAKTEFLRSQLPTLQPGPGYVHLADWLTSAQLDELVSEKRVRRMHRGKVTYEWRTKTQDTPNEGLDCRNYARAALESLGLKVVATLGARAEEVMAAAMKTSFKEASTQKPAPRAPRRRVRSTGAG